MNENYFYILMYSKVSLCRHARAVKSYVHLSECRDKDNILIVKIGRHNEILLYWQLDIQVTYISAISITQLIVHKQLELR